MEEDFDPKGWLGMIVGSNYYYDFSGKDPFKRKMQKLLQDVQRHLQNSPAPSPEPSFAEKYFTRKNSRTGTKHKILNTLYSLYSNKYFKLTQLFLCLSIDKEKEGEKSFVCVIYWVFFFIIF